MAAGSLDIMGSSLSGVNFSTPLKLPSFNFNVYDYWKTSDPAFYDNLKASALERAQNTARTAGYTGGDEFEGGPTEGQLKLLKESYNELLNFGYTPEEAQANTYGVMNQQFAQSAANKADVESSSWGDFVDTVKPFAGLAIALALPGAGSAIGSALGASGTAATVLGNAVIGGTLAEAQGGDFLKGALTSAAGSALGAATAPVTSAVSEAVGSQAIGQALTSGALAELQGGDFLQGAIQGGIAGGINDAKLALADQYINSVEPGIGYDPATSPTELDVIAAYPELAPPPVFDTSFIPDYSLATGAPVIPDMGAQGIQVPTINELVDVVGQPVDYSLPIPSYGFGLQMPTAPNLDSMGGGQGLVIPVDGGVITEAGFIPDAYVPDLGDPNSFINQPAPNVEVNIPELPAEQPKDISGELAALDLVKALAPIAIGAALNKDQPQATTDEQTGYPILPIPSEWKAPEYNMAFTPSAALDFGSPDLLQGTQWENQQVQPAQMNYSLSDVMNTLNYQSVPFVQQQMQPFEQSFSVPDILQQFQTKPNVGMNDIIGGLNGRQVSISDIISGIQSQYGQKAAS